MFKKEETIKQKSFWEGNENMLGERNRVKYNDPKGWHNQFRQEVTNRIDEEVFKPLYDEKNGRPNANIRAMVALIVLHSGADCSFEKLFEEADFNLLTRAALGLLDAKDEAPALSTFYYFRKKLVEYKEKHKVDLIEEAFKQTTKAQCLDYHVSGKKVRMDSKLLGSNIAWMSRYEILHETIRKYIKSAKEQPAGMSGEESALLAEIMSEEGIKVTYRMTKDEVKERMTKVGMLINRLLHNEKAAMNSDYELMKRVFEDQFNVVKQNKETSVDSNDKTTVETITAKTNEEIDAKSVQNPHDAESQYRLKAGNQVRGYSENLTETCDDNGLNMIVNVQTGGAGTADNTYLKPALKAAQEIVTDKIEEGYADGAFNSDDNNEFCKGENIELILTGMQGKPSKYDLKYGEDNELLVTDIETNTAIEAEAVKTRKPGAKRKWKIKDKGKTRVFTEEDVERSKLRKKMEAIPQEKRNTRNGVESAIMQLGYHFRSDKSKFRGMIKHHMWALTRCMWINFRRIRAYIADNEQKTAELAMAMG